MQFFHAKVFAVSSILHTFAAVKPQQRVTLTTRSDRNPRLAWGNNLMSPLSLSIILKKIVQ